ncbi:rhodanese-like domain-containing protein [Chitinophaga vietnamensis]|uniref:rhodanese-like domain-containing protein n=1 Tax=Chitinophaga vietnamensis TaxID=2593957 RepID=UPI001177375D|nr:rhodanese-like domain-containing protein [Chitinophaga vietnamensis]
MKYIMLCLAVLTTFAHAAFAQQPKENWNSSQLMAPKALADKINAHQTNNLLILGIGPAAQIRGSVDIGPAHEAERLQKLKDYLKDVKKDKEIVIYCGCCPFDKCPNVRPAFQVLKDMGFKNARLLNLSKNLKTDWIDKDYPTQD